MHVFVCVCAVVSYLHLTNIHYNIDIALQNKQSRKNPIVPVLYIATFEFSIACTMHLYVLSLHYLWDCFVHYKIHRIRNYILKVYQDEFPFKESGICTIPPLHRLIIRNKVLFSVCA